MNPFVRALRIALSFVFSIASLHFFSAPCFSLPLTPLDSRSIGMGGTGVASSRGAHAVRLNPALLSFANADDDVSIIIPQLGIAVIDQEELFDSVTDFVDADYVNLFETSVDNIRASADTITNDADDVNAAANGVNVAALQTAVSSLNASTTLLRDETSAVNQNTDVLIDSLASLDGKAVRGKLGGSFALAFPSQDFAMAFSIGAEMDFSGILVITPEDRSLLDIYTDAAESYSGKLNDYAVAADALLTATTALNNDITNPDLQMAVDDAQAAFNTEKNALDTFSYGGNATPTDPDDGDKVIFSNGALAADAADVDLTSNGHFVAVTTTDFGVSLSKRFQIGNQALAVGVTPKLQKFDLYDYVYQVDDGEDIDVDDVLDTKVSESAFNIDVGVATHFGKNNRWQAGAVVKNIIKQEFATELGAAVEISPQIRAGLAYNWGMLTLAADYDLTKNDNVAFGGTTQYAMLGAELELFKAAQLRVGYRTDTANSDFDAYSVGLGLSPWGLRVDISGFVNTTDADNEAGVALELGLEW